METGNKNRYVPKPCMFCEESLGKIMPSGAFPERVGSRTLSFESVDYFGTSEHFKKKTKRRIFDGEANWSGVVNFHCTQMSLVMSMRFISAMI